jgi:hypothetical protein
MTESEFVAAIDCRFPYGDEDAGRALVAQACALGSNAAFAIVNELARPPAGRSPSVPSRLALLAELRTMLRHPMAALVVAIAERMVRGERIAVEEAVSAMGLIANYPGAYGALGFISMSCDDEDDEADRFYNDVVRRWQEV